MKWAGAPHVVLGRVRGYNYTKGRDVELTLYGPSGTKIRGR